MSAITSTGYQISSLVERFNDLVAAMQDIFGTSINLDPNSFDGQTIAIIAESINNLDQLGQTIFNSFNPNTASGNALSLLVQLNYLRRKSGSYSTVTLEITGAPGITFLPAGTFFQSTDGTNTVWVSLSDAIVDDSSTTSVLAQSQTYGPFAAPIGSITKCLNPVYGFESVNNSTEAIPGSYEETDAELRARRANSTSINAQGPLDAIQGALAQITGVTQVRVYENNTDTTDSNGQDPHSIYCIVLGGDPQLIVNTIWFKRSIGVKMLGSQTGTVVDTAGWPRTINYERPIETAIYVIVNMKRRAGFPTNGDDLVKVALAEWALENFAIGMAVIQSELYAPAMSAVDNTGSILSLYIGTAPMPSTTTDITILYNHIASLDPANITVNLS